MGSKDGEEVKAESQDNYESAVLEFLEKEMAAVRPSPKPNEQSEELDALVSDLLKQVISEADQPKEARKATATDMEDVLSEFPPKQDEVLSGTGMGLHAAAPAPPVEAAPESSAKLTEETFRGLLSVGTRKRSFTLAMAAKRKIPIVATASACLLAIIGIAVYHFSSSPKVAPAKAPQQHADAAAPAVPVVQSEDVPAPVQPETKAAEQQEIPPALETTAEKKVAQSQPHNAPQPPAPAQKPAVSRAASNHATERQTMNTVTPQPELEPEPSTIVVNSAPVTPEREEKPVAQTATQRLELPAPGTAIEKGALPPIPDIAAAGKRQALALPVTPPSASLVPAIPISQVSPSYPELAIKSRTQGLVVLDLDIDAKGRVVKVTPVSGPVIFYNAAVSAAIQWRYRPASLGGADVPSKSRVTMNFNLHR